MKYDRPYLKMQAKGLLSAARPSPIAAGAIYVALSALMSFLSARLVGVSYETVERAVRFLEQGNTEYALSVLTASQPTPSAWAINLMLELVMWIVGVGFTIFVLNTLRGTGAALGNLLDGFGMFRSCKVLQDRVKLDNLVLIDYIAENLGGVISDDYENPFGQGRIVIKENP